MISSEQSGYGGCATLARWNPSLREELVHGITRLRRGFGGGLCGFRSRTQRWRRVRPNHPKSLQELWTAGGSREFGASLAMGPSWPWAPCMDPDKCGVHWTVAAAVRSPRRRAESAESGRVSPVDTPWLD